VFVARRRVDGGWSLAYPVKGGGCDGELRVLLMGATCPFQVDGGEINGWKQSFNVGVSESGVW